MNSRAILKYLILEEYVEEGLCCQCIRQPAWNFDVKVLSGSLLPENFLESVDKFFIFGFEFVNCAIFIFDMPLKFLDLMFEGSEFVIVD